MTECIYRHDLCHLTYYTRQFGFHIIERVCWFFVLLYMCILARNVKSSRVIFKIIYINIICIVQREDLMYDEQDESSERMLDLTRYLLSEPFVIGLNLVHY